MSNELTTITPDLLTPEVVRKHICAMASDQEIFLFLQIAKACKLNPFLNQIYLVKYNPNEKAQILTSYNVYLQRAERSGSYGGLETKTYGSIETKDLRAEVKVYRKDWERPLVHEVYYEEYVQFKKNTDGTKTPNKFWKEKPRTMIVKVAISQAFRLAFPLEFEGMPYTSDEVVDQDKVIDITEKPVEAVKMPLPPSIEANHEVEKKVPETAISAQKNSKETVVSDPIKQATEIFDGEPVKPIAPDVAKELIKIAQDNGYTLAMFKEEIGKYGYKKSAEISVMDYPDIMKTFLKKAKK